jgi:omega-6 fatty acid desaturase (delta-12 desaturase)
MPLRTQPAVWAIALSVGAGAAYLGCFLEVVFLSSSWARILCSAALGPLIALQFRLAHDAGHECHFLSQRLNRLVGRAHILRSYHSFSCWIYFHNYRHHAFTNLKGADYILVPLTKEEYDSLSPLQKLLERSYRTMSWVGLYYFYEIWWKKMLFPPNQSVKRLRSDYYLDFIIIVLFLSAQLCLISYAAHDEFGYLYLLMLAIVLPFFVFNWMVGFVSFFNHTHPGAPWFRTKDEWSFYIGQVCCTIHMKVPRWMVFFVTDLELHGAHHVDPRIPIWKLTPAEQEIVQRAQNDIVADSWTLEKCREIMRRCKLYDYEAFRWLDFDGQSSTEVVQVDDITGRRPSGVAAKEGLSVRQFY